MCFWATQWLLFLCVTLLNHVTQRWYLSYGHYITLQKTWVSTKNIQAAIVRNFSKICTLLPLPPPPFPTSNPFFLLYQDYSTWWYNIRIKIWLISYRLIFHDIFSTSHFKTSVGGYLRRLENLGSWHELGTNLFFCASETSYPYYFTNRVKMKKHLLATSVLLFP